MATTFTVSPTNFQIVSPQVAGSLQITVGQSGVFSNGITLTPKSLPSSFQQFVQIGLTLPAGTLQSFSLAYACSDSSFITQMNLLQVTAAGNSSQLWFTQQAQSGSGTFTANIGQPFTGSLDLTVGVVFRALTENVQIGAMTFTVA